MIKLLIWSAILAAMWQSAAADGARTALRTCIKSASTEVKGKKMAEDAFTAFVHSKCTTQESGFKSAMWSFDSKTRCRASSRNPMRSSRSTT